MNATRMVVLCAACAWPVLATAAETGSPPSAANSTAGLQEREKPFGAFAAPAALPPGAAAAYAYMGVPEVGAGYRQGVGPLELDGEFQFNYFTLSFALEGVARYLAFSEGPLKLAPSLGIGAVFDTGSRYIDEFNFGYVGLRILPGASLSYRIAETVSMLGELKVPIDISLTPGGGARYTPVVGGGAEIYVGEDITAGAMADLGMDVVKEPLGVPQTRFAFALRVGLGFRFF